MHDASNKPSPTQPTHPIFGTPALPTGVEDVHGWAYKRARSCEMTLSPEEVLDAMSEGVDVHAINWCPLSNGFGRFNGKWFCPASTTAIASGLDPATNPGEFIYLDTAECAALDRVAAHWRSQAEDGR